MAISIGNLQPALGLSGKAATVLMAAGIVALGYGAMCTAGITAEMTNHTNIAQMIYHAAEPVMKNASSLFQAVAEMAGSAPISGDLMGDAPTGMKVGASGMFMAGVGAALTIAGSKLSDMVRDIREAKVFLVEKLRTPERHQVAFESAKQVRPMAEHDVENDEESDEDSSVPRG